MTTGTLKFIRNGMLAIGICASLAVTSLGFAKNAEARVPADATGNLARSCRTLQDIYDGYTRMIGDADARGDRAEKDRLVQKQSEVSKTWDDIGCLKKFGAIFSLVGPTGVINNQEHAGPTGGASTDNGSFGKNQEGVGITGGLSPQTNPNTPQTILNSEASGATFHTLN